MRLRMLGIKYHLAKQNFDPLAVDNGDSKPVDRMLQDFQSGRQSVDVARSQAELANKSRPLWPNGERHPN